MFIKFLLNSIVLGLNYILDGIVDELIFEFWIFLIWIYIVFVYYYIILLSFGIFFKLNIYFDFLMI